MISKKYISKRKNFVWCTDFCIDGDDIWMLHGDLNGLLHYSLVTKKTNLVSIVPNNKIVQEYLFIRILKYENILILIPCLADHIVMYDISKNEIVYTLYIRDKFLAGHVFSTGFIIDDVVYCIPWKADAPMLLLNLKSNYLVEIIEFNHGIFNSGYNTARYYDGSIYFSTPDEPVIIVYNIKQKSISYTNISDMQGIKAITNSDNEFFLEDAKCKKLFYWNCRTNMVKEIIQLDADSSRMTYISNDKLWIDTPNLYAYMIDISKSNYKKIDKLFDNDKYIHPTWNTSCAHYYNHKFYYFDSFLSCFMIYDGIHWKQYVVRTDVFNTEEYKKMITQNINIVRESNSFLLNDLFEIL